MIDKINDVAPLPGYPIEYGTLLATLQDCTNEWRYEMPEIAPELVAWQPAPRSYSIGGLLLHIAEVEVYWIEEFCLKRETPAEEAALYMSAEIDQYGGSWPTPPKEPLSYYYKILDDVRARTLESVKDFGPPETLLPSKWGHLSLRWVLSHVINHEAYHGGQAVMLHQLSKHLRT